ncbi:Protein SET [Trichoplax sp. H2]|uniref:Uncharacterized protein n=1 Tax=Trichoplax adhaerens TaxID=10228 RepID=B3RNC2_TRIAD|nr:hypothetical protein TRIADDRAFT_53112 [Trichoplax adhaerens]EDV27997.1 hypothetical protein TRIADDRAFT_53112 [Trichoplax adhaerens]RDD44388.1 Protein SET [Trichoplax sp. H2]|eukprot:XP_002109831.1 hypothetical protein TRIADDRAFT_53112 [Trichoplax adhaerens]
MAEPAKKVLKSNAPSDNSNVGAYEEVCYEHQEVLENIELIQSQIEALNERGADEILQIEIKYNTIREPYYLKRAKLIEKIPHFWITVLLSHPTIGCLINEKDEDVLSYLESIDVREYEDIKSGYRITFKFSENPYLGNKLIQKDVIIKYNDDGNVISTKCTRIDWKEGMDVTAIENTVTTGSKRRREDHYKSFFSWFSSQDHVLNGDDIGDVIKDDIFPNPLQYYINTAEAEIEDDEDVVVVDDESEDTEFQDSVDENNRRDVFNDQDVEESNLEQIIEKEKEKISDDSSEENLEDDDFESEGEYDEEVLEDEDEG